jgi:hypothetical protein
MPASGLLGGGISDPRRTFSFAFASRARGGALIAAAALASIGIVASARTAPYHSRRAGLGTPRVRLSLCDQHQKCAARHRNVATHVGRCLLRLQRHIPELLPRVVPNTHAGFRDGDRAEYWHDHNRAASCAFRRRGAAGIYQYSGYGRSDHFCHNHRRGSCRLERQGDV